MYNVWYCGKHWQGWIQDGTDRTGICPCLVFVILSVEELSFLVLALF